VAIVRSSGIALILDFAFCLLLSPVLSCPAVQPLLPLPNTFLCPNLGHRTILASSLDLENLRPALDTIKNAGIIYGDILFRNNFNNLL
jgi:hypothetical protein